MVPCAGGPPFPECMHAHKTMVSPAHQRSGEVWRLSIVRSALEPDSQVVQLCGWAGKEAQA